MIYLRLDKSKEIISGMQDSPKSSIETQSQIPRHNLQTTEFIKNINIFSQLYSQIYTYPDYGNFKLNSLELNLKHKI